jgi:hypothetical protein
LTQSHIYKGDGNGGPIDYANPIGASSTNSFVITGLAPGTKTWFGIRNFDDATGLEEQNVDARTLIIVDSLGRDASDRPGSPVALVAVATAPGSVEVRWTYQGHPSLAEPESFAVHCNPGDSVDFSLAPAATVAYSSVLRDFRVTLSALQSGLAYAIGVRSVRGFADDGNTASATIVPKAVPPLNVMDLAAKPTFRE